jgi:hypothetical protein
MPKKKPLKKDTELKEFIKFAGRMNAESDFNELLKRATSLKIVLNLKIRPSSYLAILLRIWSNIYFIV